jgi:hypothetical protein
MKSRARIASSFVTSLVALATIAGCTAQTGEGEPSSSGDEAISSYLTFPQGTVCGLSHTGMSDTYFACENNTWRGGAIPVDPGYGLVFTGDWGMPSGQGFAHESPFYGTPSSYNYASHDLPIPRGTVCGLKHSKNAPHETCMGYDAMNACPAGWLPMRAYDTASQTWPWDTPGYWAWCEYQDVTAACPGTKCDGNVPRGTACGLAYVNGNTATTMGHCEGVSPTVGCPPGWVKFGPRDQGAPSGSGLMWCAKATYTSPPAPPPRPCLKTVCR